jgi:hypothetical protein
MKTNMNNSFLLSAFIAVLNLMLAGRLTAQTFTTLHNFTGGDGGSPSAGLILSGNTLYGTGAGFGRGTVLSLSFRPELTIFSSGPNMVLSWLISYAGFDYTGYRLQEAANLDSPTDWIPSPAFPPEIVNGQVRLTTSMRGPQRFYQLAKQK